MPLLLHVDIAVRDMERSLEFYTGCLGALVVEDAVIEGGAAGFYIPNATAMRLVFLKLPSRTPFGAMIELMEFRTPVKVGLAFDPSSQRELRHGIRNLSLLVENLEDTLEKLAGANVIPASEIFFVDLPKLGKSHIVFVRDPDENLVELVQRC